MRRPDRRVRRAPLKLDHDRLETRWLMSAGLQQPEAERLDELQRRALEELFTPRPDLNAFASELAHHPKVAAGMDLGVLGRDLRPHADLAARFGWGAVLVEQIMAHPRYAANHDLSGLVVLPILKQTSPLLPIQPRPPALPITSPQEPARHPSRALRRRSLNRRSPCPKLSLWAARSMLPCPI